MEAQAQSIARASYQAMQHSSREGRIASASPHCCEHTPSGGAERGQEPDPSAAMGDSSDDSEMDTSPSATPNPSPPGKPLPPEGHSGRLASPGGLPRLPLQDPPPLLTDEAGVAEPRGQLQISARELIRGCRQVGCDMRMMNGRSDSVCTGTF